MRRSPSGLHYRVLERATNGGSVPDGLRAVVEYEFGHHEMVQVEQSASDQGDYPRGWRDPDRAIPRQRDGGREHASGSGHQFVTAVCGNVPRFRNTVSSVNFSIRCI
jgi:hypothetical protein